MSVITPISYTDDVTPEDIEGYEPIGTAIYEGNYAIALWAPPISQIACLERAAVPREVIIRAYHLGTRIGEDRMPLPPPGEAMEEDIERSKSALEIWDVRAPRLIAQHNNNKEG